MRNVNDELNQKTTVEFTGELGSAAHEAHHATLMARLSGRAFATEMSRRQKVASVAARSKSAASVAKKLGTTVAEVRSAVRTQQMYDKAVKRHFSGS